MVNQFSNSNDEKIRFLVKNTFVQVGLDMPELKRFTSDTTHCGGRDYSEEEIECLSPLAECEEDSYSHENIAEILPEAIEYAEFLQAEYAHSNDFEWQDYKHYTPEAEYAENSKEWKDYNEEEELCVPVVNGYRLSLGSQCHYDGCGCQPCYFMAKYGVCLYEDKCQHCHFYHTMDDVKAAGGKIPRPSKRVRNQLKELSCDAAWNIRKNAVADFVPPARQQLPSVPEKLNIAQEVPPSNDLAVQAGCAVYAPMFLVPSGFQTYYLQNNFSFQSLPLWTREVKPESHYQD